MCTVFPGGGLGCTGGGSKLLPWGRLLFWRWLWILSPSLHL
jgi:hypothetical protein